MSEGQGNIQYTAPPVTASSIGAITGANDGLSVSTVDPLKIVLGQNVGAVGNPALVTEPRQIPLAIGTGILFSDPTIDAAVSISYSQIVISSSQDNGNPPQIRIQDFDTGAEMDFDFDYSTARPIPRFACSNVVSECLIIIARLFLTTLSAAHEATALLELDAGQGVAGTAPLKINTLPGNLLPAPEDGAVERDAINWFVTSGPTRYTLAKTLTATAVLNFPNTAAGASSDLTIALPGAAIGDIVGLGVDNASVNANSCYTAWVSAANTVTVRFNNYQLLAAIDPAAGTFRVNVTKY